MQQFLQLWEDSHVTKLNQFLIDHPTVEIVKSGINSNTNFYVVLNIPKGVVEEPLDQLLEIVDE